MGWVKRDRHRYYYRSVRIGDDTGKLYFGRGEEAHDQAALDQLRRESRDRGIAEMADFMNLDAALARHHEIAMLMAHLYLLASGYHRHKGQWRKRRVKKQQTEPPPGGSLSPTTPHENGAPAQETGTRKQSSETK